MTQAELSGVQTHLRKLFANQRIARVAPSRRNASVEMRIGEEFVGTVHRDEEDGDVSYSISIVVLAVDLEQLN